MKRLGGSALTAVLGFLLLALSCMTAPAGESSERAAEGEAKSILSPFRSRMYPVSAAEAMTTLEETLREASFRFYKRDYENGVLRTRNARWLEGRFPGLEIVPPIAYYGAGTFETKAIRVFAFVSQHVEPARVHITTRVEFEQFSPPQLVVHDHLANPSVWLFEAFEERLGHEGTPIPEERRERWELAKRLAARGGVEDPCLARAPWPEERDVQLETESALLKKAQPKLDYAAEAEAREISGDFEAWFTIMEDGAPQDIEVTGDLDSGGSLPLVTREHAIFARFVPARIEGCPVISEGGIEYTFYIMQKDRRQPLD